MIETILILMIILFPFLSKIKTGTYKNPITLFSLWWCGWLLISRIGLIGLDIPSNKTYYLFLLAIFMYFIGSIVVVNKKRGRLFAINNKKLKLLNILQISVLIIMIPMMIKVIPNILNMSASIYRMAIYESDILYSSNHVKLLFDYLIHPILLVSLLVGASGYLLGEVNRKWLFINVLNVVVISIMTLGRWYLIRILLFILIGIVFMPGNHLFDKIRNIRNKKMVKRLILFSGIIVALLMLMSSFRSGKNESIIYITYEYIVRYFTGSFIVFDKFINENFYHNIIPLQYGRATFGGLDEFFVFFIRRIDQSVVNISSIISFYTNRFIHIGGGHSYNAFYTALYNFYLDGGILAVILIPFAYGMIVGGAFNYYRKSMSIFSLSLLIYLVYISLIATLRWEFYYLHTWIAVLGLFLLITKLGLKKNNSIRCNLRNESGNIDAE